MRRLTSIAIAFAAAVTFGRSASAAGIFFQTAPTTTTTVCAAPCFQVQMFAQDDSADGTRQLQAIQFDVDVRNADGSDVVVANLPVPPATNTNASAGNTNLEDVDGNITVTPWELSSTVGKSPSATADALVVDASANPFTASSILAARTAAVGCTASATCTIQLNGLNGTLLPGSHLVYVGRFNMTGVNSNTTFVYSGATGVGELVTGVQALQGLNTDNTFSFIAEGSGKCTLGSATGCLANSAPEPASVILLGAALMGMSLVRRRA